MPTFDEWFNGFDGDPHTGVDDGLSLDMLGRPTHLSKELSALLSSHTGQQESALSSRRGTSAGDGDVRFNTRKTKKPKEWSDYTSIDSSAAVAAAAISEHGAPSTVESSAHSMATSKKPRVAVLKRKRSSNTSDTEARGTTAADDSLGSLGRTSTAAGATSASLHSEDAEEETHVSATYSRSKVVAAKERRRERNKVLARKTRVKKKVELETLREQVTLLRVENERLKSLVRSKLPTHVGANLLVECDIKLPDNVAMFVQSIVDKVEVSHGHIFEKLRTAQRSFCISNANARDQPIVYASPGFVELTGYPVAEILGRNCRFMQGVGTDRAEAAKLRLGIEQGKEASATLLNYRKDGSTFWNYIQVAPMVDHKGNTALIVGVQCEVPVPPGGGVTDLKDMASKHSQQVVNNVSGSNTSGSDDGQQGRGGQSNSNSDQGSDDGLGFMVNGSDDGFGSSFSLQREDLVWALGVRSSPDDLTENS